MRVLIVEDEPVIAQRIQRLLRKYIDEKITTIKSLSSLDDADIYLEENTIDLLLLDLNLHGEDGFELLKKLVAESFHTIIISAYAEKAIEAFEYGVLDFVAKPFNEERFNKALSRFLDTREKREFFAKKLAVKKYGEVSILDIDNINYIQAEGHYSQIITPEQNYLHDKSLDKLHALLPENFEKIHRSYIVNIKNIEGLIVQSGGVYRAKLSCGTEIPISRSKFKGVKEKLSL